MILRHGKHTRSEPDPFDRQFFGPTSYSSSYQGIDHNFSKFYIDVKNRH